MLIRVVPPSLEGYYVELLDTARDLRKKTYVGSRFYTGQELILHCVNYDNDIGDKVVDIVVMFHPFDCLSCYWDPANHLGAKEIVDYIDNKKPLYVVLLSKSNYDAVVNYLASVDRDIKSTSWLAGAFEHECGIQSDDHMLITIKYAPPIQS